MRFRSSALPFSCSSCRGRSHACDRRLQQHVQPTVCEFETGARDWLDLAGHGAFYAGAKRNHADDHREQLRFFHSSDDWFQAYRRNRRQPEEIDREGEYGRDHRARRG